MTTEKQCIGSTPSRARKPKVPETEMIRRFTVRARIVQDHSLASDKDALEDLSKPSLGFRVAPSDEGLKYEALPFVFPPTEQIESAAARVRPIFLVGDGVWYEDVLAVIHDCVKDQDDAVEVERLLQAFHSADPDYPVSYKGTEYQGGEAVNNNQLAGAWLYGHLLHHDALRQTYTSSTPLEWALYTATHTVASMMLATVETLHLIERLTVHKVLDLPAEVFTEAVTVSATEWTPPGEVRVYSAPVGTPLPTDADSFLEGQGFSPFDPRRE